MHQLNKLVGSFMQTMSLEKDLSKINAKGLVVGDFNPEINMLEGMTHVGMKL